MSNSKEIIVYTQNDEDEYFRKSYSLAHSDVYFKEDGKFSGTTERISAIILKAIQDRLFNMSIQKELQESAEQMSEEIYIHYKNRFIETRKKKLLSVDKKKEDGEALGSALIETSVIKALEGKKEELKRFAYKEAFRRVLAKAFSDDDLMFRFDAKSILDNADVTTQRADIIYKDIKNVQMKFNNWTEKRFDEVTGAFHEKEINATLFPYSSYDRYGQGRSNVISIKLEKELLHCVLFLSQSYLKYHVGSYIKLKNPNSMIMYELLIRIANDTYKRKTISISSLQKTFHTKYGSNYEFIRNVLTGSLEHINKKLGCNCSWEPSKTIKKTIIEVEFVISNEDKAILNGAKAIYIKDSVKDELLYSFGYYVMLKTAFEKNHLPDNVEQSVEGINALIAAGRYDFGDKYEAEIYAEWNKNIEAIDELRELIESNEILRQKYEYNQTLLVASYIGSAVRVADQAVECLRILREVLEENKERNPSLPGFDAVDDVKERVFKFLPFDFAANSKVKIVVDEENYNTHLPHIKIALKHMDYEKFIFANKDQKESFISAMMEVEKNEMKEELPEKQSAQITQTFEDNKIAKEVYSFFKEINPASKATESSWGKAVNKILSTFAENDIRAVIDFYRTKQGNFYLQHVSSPPKFAEKFDDHLHRANVLSIKHPESPIQDNDAGIFLDKLTRIITTQDGLMPFEEFASSNFLHQSKDKEIVFDENERNVIDFHTKKELYLMACEPDKFLVETNDKFNHIKKIK